MLFVVKRDAAASLVACAVVVLVAVIAWSAADLSWSLRPTPRTVASSVAGVGLLLLSDGLLHLALLRLGGDAYLDTYRQLVDYFDRQSAGAIAAGGLLAGGEELLFRGVVLHGLVEFGVLPIVAAVAVSAVLFGAAHLIPDDRLRPVALWAVWEGLLLGALYVATASLLVPVVAHALHDVGGFSLFAWQRGHGVESISGSGIDRA